MASVLKVDKLDPQSGTALEIGTSGDTVTVPTGAGLTVTDEVKTNKVSPATGTAFALGDSGDTFTVPSGATLDISASTLTPPATMPASSGINFTALNATNLGSGTVPTARLGTGTASSSTVLYGDQTYKTEPGGGKILQVVQATTTSASTHNTISTYTASNVFGSITPTAASSKIFISFFWLAAILNNSSTQAGGSAKIYQDIDSGGYAALYPSAVGSTQFRIAGASGDLAGRTYQTITYLDSPSYTLTDVITYKLYAAAGPSGYGNYYVCPDGDSASIVMMEVAA
jgi:hypothetical protein